MATPQITLRIPLTDLFGNALQAAAVSVQLAGYGSAIPQVAGTALLASTYATQQVPSAAGVVQVPVWGNDQIVPAGTYYAIQVADTYGNVMQCNAYSITGAARTVDVSTLTPISFQPKPVSAGVVAIAAALSIPKPVQEMPGVQMGFSSTTGQPTTSLVLAGEPRYNSLSLYRNGVLMVPYYLLSLEAAGTFAQQPDYTLNGAVATLRDPALPGDNFYATYTI